MVTEKLKLLNRYLLSFSIKEIISNMNPGSFFNISFSQIHHEAQIYCCNEMNNKHSFGIRN